MSDYMAEIEGNSNGISSAITLPPQVKKCNTCFQEKKFYEFREDSRTRDGKANMCLRCQNDERTARTTETGTA
jgi:superfamily II helicase